MKMIMHKANGLQIGQRRDDGYINLTKMAQASGKKVNDYLRLDTTKAFINELSTVTGIPVTGKYGLTQIRQGGNNKTAQGTWGHPYIAINCGQWCSPQFAVMVSQWVVSWVTKSRNPIQTEINPTLSNFVSELEDLEQQMIAIRSQARLVHTSTHQPIDEALHQSLHTVIHKQIGLINAVIEQIGLLKTMSLVDKNSDEVKEIRSTANEVQTISSPKEATVRFTVDVPDSMHRKLSILAAKTGRTKADIVRVLLNDVLKYIED